MFPWRARSPEILSLAPLSSTQIVCHSSETADWRNKTISARDPIVLPIGWQFVFGATEWMRLSDAQCVVSPDTRVSAGLPNAM